MEKENQQPIVTDSNESVVNTPQTAKSTSDATRIVLAIAILFGGGFFLLVILGFGFFGFSKSQVDIRPVNPIEKDVTEQSDFLRTLHWTLSFGDEAIYMSRSGRGKVEETFWQQPIQARSELSPEDFGLFYNSTKKEYTFAQPSSLQQMRLLTKGEVMQLLVPKTTKKENKEAGATLIEELSIENLSSMGTMASDWKALKRANYHVFLGKNVNDKNNWLTDGFVITCFVPVIGSEKYIEFSNPMTSAGSEINMCTQIAEMGIEGSIEKVAVSKENAIARVAQYLGKASADDIVVLEVYEKSTGYVVVVKSSEGSEFFGVNRKTGQVIKYEGAEAIE